MKQQYLQWLTGSTKTTWWHDSADPAELALGIGRGAIGATTNPFLAYVALSANTATWAPQIKAVLAQNAEPQKRAEGLMRIVVTHAAEQLRPRYDKTGGATGYVCAQVNPNHAGDREAMLAMARRFSQWAPNIAVKLPATAAGLDVLEDCAAEGITCTLTISYTVPQTLAIAERYRQGLRRAKAKGVTPGKCFAVIMIGRLDDYLREVAHDRRAQVSESDIRQAGLAVTKRAYSIYQQRGYEPTLIIAALRGTHHMTELAGAQIIMSIFPSVQEMLMAPDLPLEERIDREIPADVIERLLQIPDFVRAYEPDGMTPADFITYGVTQRTLSQFIESGWKRMESFRL
ncbi:MAG: transaldolase family protein [Sedimentisphaerales bacterium]|nr:transaldolase family protein [Sedimentisphaerales bacterium]